MAILKHISSKNANYGDAEKYLTFEHDEFTMKPTLDENGRLIPRTDYRIATLNCGEEDFAVACMRTNLRYGKNQKREDVKSHHYIISFDPRDAADNGLTADRKAGCKHRCTDAAMNYLKAEVMEMCHRENLYQIDLLHGSKERITEREYWTQKKGQLALDTKNAALAKEGQPIKQTKFETDKAKLRQTIRTALHQAAAFEEFAALLLREGVTVKESRGRLSYLTPDRTKPVTARRLGDDFDKAAVWAALEQNAKQRTKGVPKQYTHTQKLIDREVKRAEGKGIGYDRWAAVYNLKQMAAAVNLYQQYGFADFDELDAAFADAQWEMQESLDKLKTLESTLAQKKELQKNLLSYIGTKPVRDGLKAQKSEKARTAYRESNISDFIIAEAAVRYFKKHGISMLPKHKDLQTEIQQLTTAKNKGYNEYREKRDRFRELQAVKANLKQMMKQEQHRQKQQEQER